MDEGVMEPGEGAHVREIGMAGTAARLGLGGFLVGTVVAGHLRAFHLLPWVLGLLVFPAVLLGWQRLRARGVPRLRRRAPATPGAPGSPGAPPVVDRAGRAGRVRAIGPVAHVLTVAAFFALYLTPFYLPDLSFTSDAALVFFGVSMLLAAARGYAGCEILAISNWLLRRDDQVGCLLFLPVDAVERRRTGADAR